MELSVISQQRPCGECSACCTALGVHEIGKGEYVRCDHICEGGCAVYDTRPQSCRTYQCLWSTMPPDRMSDEFRPDRLGIIVEITENKIGKAIVAREVIAGTMDDREGPAFQLVWLLAERAKAFILIFRKGQDRKALFPPWASDEARRTQIMVRDMDGANVTVHKPNPRERALLRKKNKKKKR